MVLVKLNSKLQCICIKMYSYYGDIDEGFRRGDAMITLPPFPHSHSNTYIIWNLFFIIVCHSHAAKLSASILIQCKYIDICRYNVDCSVVHQSLHANRLFTCSQSKYFAFDEFKTLCNIPYLDSFSVKHWSIILAFLRV